MKNERIKKLNNKKVRKGKYVLYWMQQSQRTEYNHALQFAISKANELKLPLLVFFGLTENFPMANLRHYSFMLEGLNEVNRNLKNYGIKFLLRKVEPDAGAIELAKKASILVTDRGYLNIQKRWRNNIKLAVNCPLYQIESDVVVPVESASPKEEYSARTFRPRIKKKIKSFLNPLDNEQPEITSINMDMESLDPDKYNEILKSLNIDTSVKPSPFFRGGTSKAKNILRTFIKNNLDDYSQYSNDPIKDVLSDMSPYLHFGQISPLYIALKVMEENSKSVDDYLEQLIIRRELSMNFTYYNSNYDSLNALPDWAKETLDSHRKDKREYVYSFEEFEKSKTHDPYWNSAQSEMVRTGKMHGYMRMYWGKKILEWSENPEKALEIAITLNNKYELDGRDPNGYAGVLWCFGKHDRAWKEREIHGKVRWMSANGLKRKFNIDKYVERIDNLKQDN